MYTSIYLDVCAYLSIYPSYLSIYLSIYLSNIFMTHTYIHAGVEEVGARVRHPRRRRPLHRPADPLERRRRVRAI